MDFSIFDPLLTLRDQLSEGRVGTTARLDNTAVDLVRRVVQQRERTMTIAEKAKPVLQIKEILQAASAPLLPLPGEQRRATTTGKPRPRAAPRKK